MNKNVAMAVLAAAGVASVAQAQNFTFEMRLIPDGAIGAPVGAWNQYPQLPTASRIGFWLQARVSQDSGQNWGIGRFTAPPVPGVDFITVSDSVGSTIQRGGINALETLHGRGVGYRTGGLNVGATGNAPGSAPFPGITANENGGIDQGGTRIYGMDAWVDGDRTDTDTDGDGDVDDNGDGLPENPWRVNGAATSTPATGPVPNGQFSPWANLYRVWLVPTNSLSERTITLNVTGQLNGTTQAAPVQPGSPRFAMDLGAGQTVSATYSFTYGIPTPGAAALMGIGALAAARRRR